MHQTLLSLLLVEVWSLLSQWCATPASKGVQFRDLELYGLSAFIITYQNMPMYTLDTALFFYICITLMYLKNANTNITLTL